MRHYNFTVLALVLFLGVRSANADSMYSVIEPGGKEFSWRVDSYAGGVTYSVHDKATDTWRKVTDPNEILDIARRTAQAGRQIRMTPQERVAQQSRAAAAKPPAARVPGTVDSVISVLRTVLVICSVIFVFAVIVGIMKSRQPSAVSSRTF